MRASPALRNWLYGFTPPERGTIVLRHRRVYIVPTRMGWLFGATLAVLLVGSINYALQLGFALTFALAGIGLAGMVHTARNLARVAVTAGRVEPVFAGAHATFRLHLDNRADHDRPSMLVRHLASGAQTVLDIPPLACAEVALAVPAPQRGWMPLGRVMLETRFPLGLFRAWSHVEPEQRALVYPRPLRSPLPPASADDHAGQAPARARGQDDFSGLRGYQPSDPPPHVAWKAVARADEMLTKQFSGDSGAELWLDWAALPAAMGTEERLSRLAGWVLDAERAGARYGLRLPGRALSPGHGEEHRGQCLAALALHGGAD